MIWITWTSSAFPSHRCVHTRQYLHIRGADCIDVICSLVLSIEWYVLSFSELESSITNQDVLART